MAGAALLHKTVLPNGLPVVVAPQPHLQRAYVAMWARVGSRFETPKDSGISHFLEHMIYRGTRRIPSAHAVNLAFEGLGGSLFASTQVDHGIFSMALPPESIEEACGLFGEVLSQPAFLDIDVERGIVAEEILEDLDEDGRQIDADNVSRALIYGDHPLGFTITGTEAHVRSFTEEMLRRWHGTHYTAANAALVFSGRVDPESALRLAHRHFADLPRGERVRTQPPPLNQRGAQLEIVENVSSQTELRICFRACAETDLRRPALDMLMRVIDDGMSTRLYHRLCDSRGLCYDVSAGYDPYEDDGVVDVAAGVQHKRVALVTGEILALFEDLAREGPTEEELAKARRRVLWDARSMTDSAEEMGSFYAGALLFERPASPEEHVAGLVRVTPAEVRDVARWMTRPERLSVTAVGLPDGEHDDAVNALEDLVLGWRGPSAVSVTS